MHKLLDAVYKRNPQETLPKHKASEGQKLNTWGKNTMQMLTKRRLV